MLINSYRNTTPFKALVRDLVYMVRYVYLFFRNGFRNKTILFYPHMPFRKAAMYSIVNGINYNMTNNPNHKFDLVINWEDVTIRKHDPVISELNKKMRVINYKCTDISKDKVEELFAAVFGYSSLVDPFVYQGECVEKNTINGKHDASIIVCPIPSKKKGYIYQKLINDTENGMALNYRVPVFGNSIPFLTQRYKPLSDRFDCTESARLVDLHKAFTQDEIVKILKFCRLLGLDYGELDVMRDKGDGRIYILDANNTPTIARLQTSIKISDKDRDYVLRTSIKAFKEIFVKPSNSHSPQNRPVEVQRSLT